PTVPPRKAKETPKRRQARPLILPEIPAWLRASAPRMSLDALEIATPCQVPWEDMPGDERVRYCGRCRQNVYNVAGMAGPEALLLIGRKEGRVCLRLCRRPDGTVITTDCWTRLRQARRRGWLAWAGLAAVLLWAQI